MKSYLKWSEGGINCDGIVVGSDITLEWLLPWWWENYRKYNDFPVIFVDFGMSRDMKKWCKERGAVIRIPPIELFVAEKKEIDPSLKLEWEKKYGCSVWEDRKAWFKKPLACLQSPYHRSIWVDLDCEVRGSLRELFSCCHLSSEIAVAKERPHPIHKTIIYNSGVVVFKGERPSLRGGLSFH